MESDKDEPVAAMEIDQHGDIEMKDAENDDLPQRRTNSRKIMDDDDEDDSQTQQLRKKKKMVLEDDDEAGPMQISSHVDQNDNGDDGEGLPSTHSRNPDSTDEQDDNHSQQTEASAARHKRPEKALEKYRKKQEAEQQKKQEEERRKQKQREKAEKHRKKTSKQDKTKSDKHKKKSKSTGDEKDSDRRTSKKKVAEEDDEEEEEAPSSGKHSKHSKQSKQSKKDGDYEQEDSGEDSIEEFIEYDSDEQAVKKKKKKAKKAKKQQQPEAPKTPVDRLSGRAHDSHVLDPYSTMLSLTDVNYGVGGHNKFYFIQLLQNDRKAMWHVFTKWGRVGAKTPQFAVDDFSSLEAAENFFQRKFSEKTGNDWVKRHRFRPIDGKYTVIEVELGGTEISLEQIKKNLGTDSTKPLVPSQLDEPIQELMRLICDPDRMQRTLSDLHIDTDKYPLGRLSTAQIQKGFAILNRIQVLLDSGSEAELIKLSNDFYTNIPQSYGLMKKPPVINSLNRLKEKVELLETLADLEIAKNFMSQDLSALSSMNPLDAYFKSLRTRMSVLDHNSDQFNLIKEVIQTTHAPTHHKYSLVLEEVFEMEREGEKDRYHPFKALPNKTLLWHGSRVSNFLGILSKGLRIAPPEAPVSGYMFGKGIYFADLCSKSANYCHADLENNEGLLLLSEVALGNCQELLRAKQLKRPPIPYHSVKGCGKMVPPSNGQRSLDGLTVHSGAPVDSGIPDGDLQYNEYVVYDVGQVFLRYLVRVRFEFQDAMTN